MFWYGYVYGNGGQNGEAIFPSYAYAFSYAHHMQCDVLDLLASTSTTLVEISRLFDCQRSDFLSFIFLCFPVAKLT